MKLEICAYSVESVTAAARGGADRVELCDNPQDGGTTPSYGCIESALSVPNIAVNVIIRPRGGDFCYSDTEFAIMKKDIQIAKSIGANGVVFGILKPDGSMDMERNNELVEIADGMDITIHRAFDMCADPFKALDDIIALGIKRVLTSGTRNTAMEGIDILENLVKYSAGRVGIMAGSGVRVNNIKTLYDAGLREFHSSASGLIPSKMKFRNPYIKMGKEGQTDEYAISLVDEATVREIRRILDNLDGLAVGN